MNLISVEFPSTVNLNTLKAYFNFSNVLLPKVHKKYLQLGGSGTDVNASQPKSLRHLILDDFVRNWGDNPVFKQISRQEDRNYLLSHLDMNLPLKLLSTHIYEDSFWQKIFQQRWKTCSKHRIESGKPWINIYMERHLQEFLEKIEVSECDLETIQATLDICAFYINYLEINSLQPGFDGQNDHIPLDFILSNLPKLHTLRLAYCTKRIGTNFYLGCNTLSQNDTNSITNGLSKSYELTSFCIHSTKLESYQLRFFARGLDKGCQNLTTLSLIHCNVGDEGIRHFLACCSHESFGRLIYLDLTNNKITSEGAYVLSKTLQGLISLQTLILRLNPIQNDGAAALFSVLNATTIKKLNLSGCSLNDSIMTLFIQFIIKNQTICEINISNNHLGENFGINLYKLIELNNTLYNMDLRNTGLSLELRNKIQKIFFFNYKMKYLTSA